jgi:hypothetical protein
MTTKKTLEHLCPKCKYFTKFVVPEGELEKWWREVNSADRQEFEEVFKSKTLNPKVGDKRVAVFKRARLCTKCKEEIWETVEVENSEFYELVRKAERMDETEKKLAVAEKKLAEVQGLSKQLSGVLSPPKKRKSKAPSPQPPP